MESRNKTHTRDCVHGDIYQLKLLMLFLYGGIKNEYSFHLGTEIEEAKKFDDIVFKYTHKNKEIVRLLQAKHNKDGKKRITSHALLSEADGDYSLAKYFFSYEELTKSYPEGSIKDVIICTNADFDISDLERAQVAIEPIEDEDEILDIICTDTQKKSLRYKFCKNVASTLKPILESYHLTRLARRVVECIVKGNTMQHHQQTDIFPRYHLILAKDVFDTENERFQSKFINNENLSPKTKRFRDLLQSELKKKPENKLNLENINKELSNPSDGNEKIKLSLSKKFGKGYTADHEWPQTVISDNKIDDFLNHLVFAVNQPNEEELGDILKRKIGNGFNYITSQYLYDKVFQNMLQLLQGKKGKRFFSHLQGKELLGVGINEIFSHRALQYEDELRHISFERNVQFNERSVVQNFLSSDKNIWQIYSDTPWLSSLAVYQELCRNSKNFRFLFLPWNYLQENPKIISDFKEIELMIIICTLTDDKGDEITKNITERINIRITGSENALKKLIYIAADRHDLTKILTSNNIHVFEGKLAVSFSDLTCESQESIVQAKIIRFQGSLKKKSIRELLRLEEEQLLKDEIKALDLGVTELEMLLKNRNLDLWEKQPTLSDVQSIYYKPNWNIKNEEIRESIKKNPKDIFMFAVKDCKNRVKELLPDKQLELYKFKDIVSTFKPTIHRFILLDTEKGEEQYKELCYVTDILIASEDSTIDGHAIHLLKQMETGWLWMCTYSRYSYIQRNFYPIAVGQQVLRDLLFNRNCGFKIVSGISKDDLLNRLEITNKKDILTVSETSLILPGVDPDLEFLFCKIQESFRKYDHENILSQNLLESLRQQDNVTFIRQFAFIFPEIEEERKISFRVLGEVNGPIVVKFFHLLNNIQRCNFHLKSFEKSVHWFKACAHNCGSEIFHWHRSEGDVSKIRRIIEKNSTHLLSEGNLANSKQRIILLAGEPGSGKSVTLAHIAEAIKKEKPESLVLKMELKRYKTLLTSKYWRAISDVLHFLSFLDKKIKNNLLGQKLFLYLLNHTDGVILLFDGFDELSPREQDCALALFHTIKTKTKATMWIATRRNDHANIERKLNVLAYTFEPWNRNLQIADLTKFWDTALKFSNVRNTEESFHNILEKQAEEILNCFEYKLGGAENVINPLIIRMVAEMHLEKMMSLDKEISSSSFHQENYDWIEDFYRAFVNKKYDIYLHENLNMLDSGTVAIIKSGYTKEYGRLAVKSIFHESGKNFQSKKEVLHIDTLLKIGLLEGNENAPNFIHHTFAEYFATDRVTRKLKSSVVASEKLWSFLLNEIMMCYTGRRFFDERLKSDEEVAHFLDQSENKDIVFRLILEQSRNVYSVLWYAAMDNLEETLNFLLKSAKSFDCLKEISVHLFEDEILIGKTSFILMIKYILKYGKELDAHRLDELIAAEKYNILYRSVVFDNLECVDMLINTIEDSDRIVEVIKLSACYKNFGKTALHIAFENSNMNIVEKCIEKLDPAQRTKIFNIRDSFNGLPSNNDLLNREVVQQSFNSRYKQYFENPLPNIPHLKRTRNTICFNLLKHIDNVVSDFCFFHLYLEPYLPAFEERKSSRRGAVITRLFTQFLFLINSENVMEMIKCIEKIYRNSFFEKSSLNPRSKEDISLVNVLTRLANELDIPDHSVPSKFLIHREYKDLDDLRRYISEEIGESADFAIHLGVASRVLAVCRINEKYIYFDSAVCAVFGLKHINDTVQILEKAVELSAYQVQEGGFLVEHFNTNLANVVLDKKKCSDYTQCLKSLEILLDPTRKAQNQ